MAPDDTDPLLADDDDSTPSNEPTVNESQEEDGSGPTAEQLDADQRADEAEQSAAQAEDDAERQQEAAEEQSSEDEAASYRQQLRSLQEQADQHSGGLLSTIVHALNPFASDEAAAHNVTPAAPQQTAPSATTEALAQRALPPLEDRHLAELSATVQVTPEEVAEFKRMNPLFANFDDVSAEQALKEITASTLIASDEGKLRAAEGQHLAAQSVEPIPLPPVSLWSRIRSGLRDYALHPQTPLDAVKAVGAGIAEPWRMASGLRGLLRPSRRSVCYRRDRCTVDDSICWAR
jgi:hypothetical protein